MEGVMMKNQDTYAIAVRKPNNEIVVEKNTHKNFSDKVKLFKLPIFRGMIVFVDSLVIGLKALNYSASFFEDEEEQNKDKKKNKEKDKKKEKKKAEQSNALMMAAAVILSIGLSIALFMVLPVLISGIFSKLVTNHYALTLMEGLIRLAIFIGYVLIASQMSEIKRVFMYHGAEHKTINCVENGFELTVENVRWQSKQNKRCGTSFMLFVMVISLIIFLFLPSGNLGWRILTRVLLIPVISGISYEFIRFAGKTDNVVLNFLSKPGLLMQGLTTKEPDDSMIEVAIKSVEAVFDWQAFLEASEKKTEGKRIGKKARKPARKKEANKAGSAPKDRKTEKPEAAVKAAEVEAETKAKDEIAAASLKNSKEDRTKKAANAGGSKESTHNKSLNQKQASQAQTEKENEAAKTSPSAVVSDPAEEEDDEILKALDKYLDV